jgi:phosphodiesterase/alkaline phosphatase D-like protein
MGTRLHLHRTRTFNRRAAVTGIGMAAALAPHAASRPLLAQEGTAEAQPETALVLWAWGGAATPTSFAVRAALKTTAPDAQLVVSERDDLADARMIAPLNDAAASDVLHFPVEGLQPDTDYWYAVSGNGITERLMQGHVRTFPEGAATFTFAFSACANTGSNARVFETIRNLEPLFFLHTGDFHYADIEENDPALYRAAFDAQLVTPRQSELYRSTPIAYIWDDHDFGPNNSDSTSPGREAAQENYRNVVPHYPVPDDGAIYQAFTVGRARFIMTDNYSYRSPDDDEDGQDKTMLGERQKDWLKQELLAASGTYPVIVWVNSQPWISITGPDGDGWGPFATEREEIATFIVENGIGNLVMLSGDAHMLAIDDGTNNTYGPGGGAGFPVFHAAALDRDGSVKGGPYSEGTYPGPGHFGVMTVHDEGGDGVEITWSGQNKDGEELVRHRFRLAASGSATPAGSG